MEAGGEGEVIAFTEEGVIDKEVSDGYDVVQPEPAIKGSLELGMLGSMHPLED